MYMTCMPGCVGARIELVCAQSTLGNARMHAFAEVRHEQIPFAIKHVSGRSSTCVVERLCLLVSRQKGPFLRETLRESSPASPRVAKMHPTLDPDTNILSKADAGAQSVSSSAVWSGDSCNAVDA